MKSMRTSEKLLSVLEQVHAAPVCRAAIVATGDHNFRFALPGEIDADVADVDIACADKGYGARDRRVGCVALDGYVDPKGHD